MKKTTFRIILGAIIIAFMASCSSNQMAFHKRKYQPWFASNSIKIDKKIEADVQDLLVKEVSDNELHKVFNETLAQEKTAFVENTTQDKNSIKAKSEINATQKQAEKVRVQKPTFTNETESQIEAILANKQAIQEAPEGQSSDDVELILYILLAIILPPLAVFLIHGLEVDFWLSVILTILGYVPGQVYAVFKVLKKYGKL